MYKRIKYLIIEDDAASVKIIKWELMRMGYQADYKHVENEQQMRRQLLDNSFDVIISDHYMPAFSSLDALFIRNEMAPAIPFIILSTNIPAHAQQEACMRGCNAVLDKNHIDLLGALIAQLVPDCSKEQVYKL